MQYCSLRFLGRNQLRLLYFSQTFKYTGESNSLLLMAVFYKIRTARSIINKGSINIVNIVLRLFSPLHRIPCLPNGTS